MLLPVCAHCRKPGPLRDSPAGWLCDLCWAELVVDG